MIYKFQIKNAPTIVAILAKYYQFHVLTLLLSKIITVSTSIKHINSKELNITYASYSNFNICFYKLHHEILPPIKSFLSNSRV